MTKLFSFILFIIIAATLINCAGEGSSYIEARADLDQNVKGGKVYILRDTGYSCSACLVTLTLNGRNIGKIGDRETAIAVIDKKENFIKAEVKGVQTLGMAPNSAKFEAKKGENKFFIIQQKMGLRPRLFFSETSSSIWNSQASN